MMPRFIKVLYDSVDQTGRPGGYRELEAFEAAVKARARETRKAGRPYRPLWSILAGFFWSVRLDRPLRVSIRLEAGEIRTLALCRAVYSADPSLITPPGPEYRAPVWAETRTDPLRPQPLSAP
ncbi:MAG: hypothetical protein M0P73_19580 [Syntrophobacterales bacterium]|nr:hypothetical protein [Syntrophobacterales bacterium]